MVEVEAKKGNQQVVMTRWCLVWPAWLREKQKSNQQAIKARWCSLWPAWSRDKRKKAPMSHNDLLVLVVACVVKGEVKKGTNESL